MTGNKLIDLIISILSLVVTGFAAFVFFQNASFEAPLPDEDLQKRKLLAGPGRVVPYETFKIKKMIINIQSSSNKLRFLDITIHLVPYKSTDVKILEDRKHIIRDTIINIASKMWPENLNTVSGKLILEDRIKKNINEILDLEIVREIFFSSFVIQ